MEKLTVFQKINQTSISFIKAIKYLRNLQSWHCRQKIFASISGCLEKGCRKKYIRSLSASYSVSTHFL
jgi:hypothetical protein